MLFGWGNEDGLKPWFPDADRVDRARAIVAEFSGEGRGKGAFAGRVRFGYGWGMGRGAAILLLILTGCNDRAPVAIFDDGDDARILRSEVAQLRTEIESLKNDVKSDRVYLEAVAGSLKEARENHAALLKTFNSNVEIDNGRNDALRTNLGHCGKEWVQGDQGWVTVNADCSKVKNSGR